jgi:hypothetical protein
MKAVAAELSGYAGKFRCVFGEARLKTVRFQVDLDGTVS